MTGRKLKKAVACGAGWAGFFVLFQNCAPASMSSSTAPVDQQTLSSTDPNPAEGSGAVPVPTPSCASPNATTAVPMTSGINLVANGTYSIKLPPGCSRIVSVLFYKRCLFYPSTNGTCQGTPVEAGSLNMCGWDVYPGGRMAMPVETSPGVFTGSIPEGWALINSTTEPSLSVRTDTTACVRQIQTADGSDTRVLNPSASFDGAIVSFR